MPAVYAIAALIVVAVIAGAVNNYRPRRASPPAADPLNPTTIPLENAVMIRENNFRKMINLVLMLVAIGIVLWLINTYVPMAHSINAILNIVVVLGTCVLVLKAAGLWGDIVRTWHRFVGRRLTH